MTAPMSGAWRWDVASDHFLPSPEALAIFGVKADGLVCGDEHDLLVHPADRTASRDIYARAAEGAAPLHHAYRIVRPSGEVRFIEEEILSAAAGVVEARLSDVTQRTRLERSLLRAQSAGRVGSWEYDPRIDSLWWSDQTYRLLGYEPRSFTPKAATWLKRVHPDDLPRVEAIIEDAARRQAEYSVQYRLRLPDGEIRTLVDHGEFADGIEVGYVMDMTDHLRAERNLNLAQKIAQVGSWEWSLRSDDHWCSEQCYRLFGIDPVHHKLSNQLWRDTAHPEDLARLQKTITEAVDAGRPYSCQYRLVRPDGEERIVIKSGEPLSGDRYVGTLVDVTERVRVERNLADAQRIAQLGIWSVDGRTGERRWSAEMYRLIGAVPDCAPPSVALWATHIHADDRDRVLAVYEETDRTPSSYHIQYRVIRADKQTRHIFEQCEFSDGVFSGYAMDITERQTTLRHLAKAQEIARIGTWEWDPITAGSWFSDELYVMLGLDPATWQYSRENWLALVHPDDRERVRTLYTDTDARNADFALQFQMRQPDGSYRLYYEQSELNDAGTFTGILWDITDLTRAQRNMMEAQRIAKIGSWEWELDHDRHWWSDECYRILGIDADRVPPSETAWDALTHPDDIAWTDAEFNEATAAGRSYAFQYRIIRPDGHVRTVFETAELISAGKYAGTVMDVTERVKIEARLAESQRIAKLGTWEWNVTTDDRSWSEECYRLYGVSPSVKPVTRAIWQATVHPDDLASVQSMLAGIEENPRPYSYRCRIKRPDGVIRIAQVHGEPVADFGPNNPTITGTILDITERESIETQLQHAQKMEAVGQLTGGIAHDFNNLLGAVLGNIDLLMEEIDDRPRAKKLAERATAAAESGAQLVRRLLAFSRKQTLNAQVTDVNELIVNMLELLRRSLGDKAHIDIALGAGPIYCVIDRAQTEGALLNLCINARDAMPDGGGVTVGTRVVVFDEQRRAGLPELRPGLYAELTVSDIGVGMPRPVLERAFEPFFTTKAPGKGSGLGLSMVYGFVKQSEGHIEIQSEPARGTTVCIYLPIHAEARRSAADLRRPVPSPSRGRELVLVVEDNPDLRGYAVNAVRSYGYRALSAPSAKTALQLLDDRSDIALLFTDIVFKDGPTGIQLADLARRRRPDLPVLLTSGYLGDVAAQGRIDQANTFTLAKPFRAADIGRKLAEIFGADLPRILH
jgi:PAS domain S-box-containing protein